MTTALPHQAERILVVDDSLTVRMDIAEALEDAGFDVVACADLASARAALADRAPALVVLDVRLPDGDGVDLLREIRTSPALSSTPVLLLSSEGAIGARVRGLGAGASEYIGKPYALPHIVARARSLARRGEAPRAQGRSILLIDDSPTFRALLRDALETGGYAVTEAASGEEGLAVAASLHPDAVIVDGQLPGIDGRTVVRFLRSDASLRATPCLLLTADDDATAERRSLDAGADAFTRKSDDLALLLVRLEALLRRQRTPDGGTMPSLHAPKRVLAVDDSAPYLERLSAHLRADGYDVVSARTGEEALELLGAQSVDCILLDLVLPGLSGQETCKRIEGSPEHRDVPLLMLSAREDRDAMVDGINSGADDFVPKSADVDVLRARVRAQLRRKHMEDESRRIREKVVRREIEARFQRLLHSQIIGVIVADRGGKLTDANDAFFDLLGASRDALDRGELDLLSITSSGSREATRAALEQARSTGSAPRLETELLRPDGRRVAVSLGLALPDDGDSMVGFVLDRTEQKLAEEALRQTNDALAVANRELLAAKAEAERSSHFKSKFLANMSHELRTPLNAIIGFSELIVSGDVTADMPEHAEFIADILASGRHLHRIINEVLDLSKVEAGKLEFFPERVELAPVVQEVVNVLRAVSADRGVSLVTDLDPTLTEVVLDPSRLKQVLYNYISNAIRYSRSGGSVTVRTRAEGVSDLRVEVTDEGEGIAEQDLELLFREFQQVGAGARKRREGTGLGLALTKQLVEAQGGLVGVTSELGVGSTFYAVLPRSA